MSAVALRAEAGLPLALRAAYVVWFTAWWISYQAYFGWQFVLWFCCLANVYVLIGCLTQRALWFSLAAVAALGVQLIYIVDFASTVARHAPLIGATTYMLDEARPLTLRVFSLFHVWMPFLLVYAIARLGYDRRAFWIQTAVALLILPIGYFAFDPSVNTNDAVMPLVHGLPFDRDFNLNWVHAFYDHPEPGAGTRRLWTLLCGYPLVFHLPTHLLLSRRGFR
jgi:hypothetical protein